MDIVDYIKAVKKNYDDSPVYDTKKFFLKNMPQDVPVEDDFVPVMPEGRGLPNPETRIQELATGGVATPKRGLVDEPGSYSGDKREALKNWMSSQKGDIKRTDLVKKVDEIFDVSDAVKHTSRLIKTYPDIFKNFKILEKADVTGTKDFRNFLEKTKSKKQSVPELIEKFKKKTGKDINRINANLVATEFSDKFKLKAGKPPIVYTESELAAAKKYKNLPQETKFDFQSGGAAQANKYNNFLKSNNIQPTKNNKVRFTNLLKEQGLYVKAPVRDPGQVKNLKRRKTNIRKTGNFQYEESLNKYKVKILESLGVAKDKLKGGGERVAIQLAHRLSFDQLAVLGGQYSGENIGADFTRINVKDAKILENELKPLYKKQANAVRIAKKFPIGKIPKQLSKSIDDINFQISELVAEKSNGRIQGVQVDPKNLKVYSTPVDARFSAAFGVDTTEPYKNMKGSLARKKYLDDIFFKLNFAEQIKNEALQSGLIKSAPKNFGKNALNLAIGDTSTRASVASFLGTGEIPDMLSKFSKTPFGKATKLVAVGEAVLAPLFVYGGSTYGLPFKRALYEGLYGSVTGIGQSKSEALKEFQPQASTFLDFNDAQQKYNTLLNNYNNASPYDKLRFKDKMAEKTKEFQNLKNQYESLPLPERIQSEAAAGKAETQYEDLLKANRERRYQYGVIPKKELFMDIKDYFGNIGKNIQPTENVLGASIPMGAITGQTQYEFANGGIASLTRTTPPERGPQYRGLDYLRKHGREY